MLAALLFEPVAKATEWLAIPRLVGVPPGAEARGAYADQDRATELSDLEIRPRGETTTTIFDVSRRRALPPPLFALDFQTIDGPQLRITAGDGSVEI